jgi:hypothetical protein
MDYYSKYLKYKHKYTELKKLIGGNNSIKDNILTKIKIIEANINNYNKLLKTKNLPNRENTETLLLGQKSLLYVEKNKLKKLK